jgi:hypothetical protein
VSSKLCAEQAIDGAHRESRTIRLNQRLGESLESRHRPSVQDPALPTHARLHGGALDQRAELKPVEAKDPQGSLSGAIALKTSYPIGSARRIH